MAKKKTTTAKPSGSARTKGDAPARGTRGAGKKPAAKTAGAKAPKKAAKNAAKTPAKKAASGATGKKPSRKAASKSTTPARTTTKKTTTKKTARKPARAPAPPSKKSPTTKKAPTKKPTTRKPAARTASAPPKARHPAKPPVTPAGKKPTKPTKKAGGGKSERLKADAPPAATAPPPAPPPAAASANPGPGPNGADTKPARPSRPKRPKPPAAVMPEGIGGLLSPGGPAPKPLIASSNRAQAGGPAQAEQYPTKSPFTKRELDKYRQILLRKRAEVLSEVTGLEGGALTGGGSGNLSHTPQHMADAGSDAADQTLSLDLAAAERNLIKEIDAALKRVADGVFGLCVATGKPISKERLAELPWARYSIDAARRFEGKR